MGGRQGEQATNPGQNSPVGAAAAVYEQAVGMQLPRLLVVVFGSIRVNNLFLRSSILLLLLFCMKSATKNSSAVY